LQKEIKKLRRVAGGDTYTIIYLKLELLSLKNGGILIFDGVEDDVVEELALEIDEKTDDVNFLFMYLKKIGWVEQIEEDMFLLPKTVENIASEGQSAERVRKHREKKMLQCNAELLPSNAPVTICNTDIDIDKDIDLDKDKELKKKHPLKHKYGEYKNVLLSDEQLEKLKGLYPDWELKIKNLDEGIERKGYVYKNHFLVITKWAANEKQKSKGNKNIKDELSPERKQAYIDMEQECAEDLWPDLGGGESNEQTCN